MKSIKHLPRTVHTSLRSSVYLPDLPRVVEELILNSIDTCSTKVHVSLNTAGSYLKVDDNGLGMTREGLEHLGQICDEATIHVENLSYRGETLGSLSDISLVEVITKARGWPNSYRKVIKGWNCLFLGISDVRQDVGTTVIVRDLFYNQPVRRKYSQSSAKKVLHSVKKCLVRVALVHPQVSFKLTDIENNILLLSTVPCASPLPLIADAFGNDISDTLLEINASDGVYKLSGYLSRTNDIPPAMAFQLLYINSRFVSKGPVQKLIRDLASDHQRLVRLWKSDTGSQNCKRSKTQGHASYMLKLFCPVSTYDLNFEPSKTLAEFKDWSHVSSFIEQAIRHFWKQHASEISQDELETTDVRNKKHDIQSPYHYYCQDELFSLEFSSKDLDAYPKEGSAECLKKIAASKTCQCTDICCHRTGSIWKGCSDVDEGLKEASIMHMMDSMCNDDLANVSLLHIDSSESGLATPAYQSSNKRFGKARDAISDDILAFGCSNSTADIICDDLNLYLPSTPCQDQAAELKSPFLLKRCRWKLDFLSGDDLETDQGAPKKVKENQSYTRVLGKGFSSNFDNKLVDTKCCFKSPMSTIKSIKRNMLLFDKYRSDADATNEFGFTEHRFLKSYSQGSESSSEMSLPFSKYGDNSFREHKKSIPLESPFNDFDSVGLSSGGDSIQFESRGINNREKDKYPRGSLFSRDHVHRRSHSAPPFDRRKSKFSLLFNCSDTDNPCENFLQPYTSMKKPTKQNSDEYTQYRQRNCDDEMLPICKKNNIRNQHFCHSDAEYADFQNPIADCAMDEIDPQDSTAKWRGDSLGLPTNKQVERGQKFSCSSDDILNISSGFLSVAGSFLQPESISRDSFQDAKVLLQLDKKFIPIVADGILAVIDQHAADERIRLEELRQKVLSDGGTGVTYLGPEKELVLPEIMYQLLQNYSEQIMKWGWKYEMQSQCSEPFSKNLNVLKRRPPTVTLNVVPCILGINLTDKDLIEFLEQLAETDGSAGVPPSVNRLLNSKACRGAIMFGDTLLPSECSLLVEELKKTSLCFQCAHGRPTAAPLVNVVGLRRQLSSLQLQTREQADCWHGLRRHMPCLERAQQRLSAAMRFHHQ